MTVPTITVYPPAQTWPCGYVWPEEPKKKRKRKKEKK